MSSPSLDAVLPPVPSTTAGGVEGTAAKSAAPKGGLAAAAKSFDGEVRCLTKARQTDRFGYQRLLGGEATTFDKTLARLE